MANALIFGINGQDGHYLSELLKNQNFDVLGVSRSEGPWTQGDVGDAQFVKDIIRSTKPALIFHFAAVSSIAPNLFWEHQRTILQGSLNIMDAASSIVPNCKIFITGSGLQFENHGEPISEKAPFQARDSYSLARIQSVYAARYFRSRGLQTYIGYLFHHDSPYRKSKHLNRIIADAARNNSGQRLELGDVKVEKEFGFAGDIAEGIFQLVSQDRITEACIGTGSAYSIEYWLELCYGLAGKNWKDHVSLKKDYIPDFPKMVSDPRLMHEIGWQSKTSIEELAKMMMNAS